MITFIDLFAGIGGFRLALERHGLPCVFSSEIDDYARKAYWANFAEYPAGDITAIDAKDVPAHDVLCAGFPCQSFSLSGFRQGFKDKRGELFFEIIRIAKHHQPKVMLLENVVGLVSIDGGDILKLMINELEAIGYEVQCQILNSSLYGIPQTRRRLYFICLHKNSKLSWTPPKPTYEEIYLKDVLEDEVGDEFYVDCDDITWKDDPQLSMAQADNSARTTTRKGIRKLTPLECKRIMGFPDDFILGDPEPFSNEQQYKLLGNAVIPKMIELIYGGICHSK